MLLNLQIQKRVSGKFHAFVSVLVSEVKLYKSSESPKIPQTVRASESAFCKISQKFVY